MLRQWNISTHQASPCGAFQRNLKAKREKSSFGLKEGRMQTDRLGSKSKGRGFKIFPGIVQHNTPDRCEARPRPTSYASIILEKLTRSWPDLALSDCERTNGHPEAVVGFGHGLRCDHSPSSGLLICTLITEGMPQFSKAAMNSEGGGKA
jgi:hypothetical protein